MYNPVDINNTKGMMFRAVTGVKTQYTYRAHLFTRAPVETPTRYFQKTPELEVRFMVQEIEKHHSLAGANLTTGRSVRTSQLSNGSDFFKSAVEK